MSEAMHDDNDRPEAEGPCATNEDLAKFRNWVIGPFEMVKRRAKYGEMSPEWQLEDEYLGETGPDDDNLKRFARAASVEHLDLGELLTAMRIYEVRKHLRANVKGLHLVSSQEESHTILLVPERRERPEARVLGASLNPPPVQEHAVKIRTRTHVLII